MPTISLRKLAGPVIGVSVLALLFAFTDPSKIAGYVSHVNPLFLVLAAATELVGGFLYSLAWFIILKPSGVNISLRRTYVITMGSLFLIYTTPTGVAAEAARIALARKHAEGDVGGPTASVIVHRVLYAVGFMSVAGVAILLVYGALSSSPFARTAVEVLGVTALIVAVVMTLVVRANGLRSGVKWIGVRFSPILARFTGSKEKFDPAAVDKAFDSFIGAMKKMAHSPVRLVTSYAVIAIRWALVSVVALLVMYAIGYHGISIWAIMIVMMIAEIVSTTPIGIPGMIGVLDFFVITSYIALGVPPAVATATDLLTRLVLYVVNLPLTGSLFYTFVRNPRKEPQPQAVTSSGSGLQS